MNDQPREQRLADDLAAVRGLHRQSSLFEFEASGDPPDRYTITFTGKGIRTNPSGDADVELAESHKIEIRLPASYPQRPPDIRWVTPIFHPNVSFGGFLDLRDVGLPWEPTLTLDIVIERLWDVVRLAYFDLDRASNFSAKTWFAESCTMRLPTDPRSIRNTTTVSSTNIVRYERRGESTPGGQSRLTIEIDESTAEEIFFIGDDAPAADAPAADSPADKPKDGDDDILYIGWD